ncbi:hypothetical protein [Legionella spiritensis]|uniref:Uncharacterized protein n=1 Tax=Legionella spiritensis TaxID=452 RepID=A0A0W0YY68_LEGSP|nr:hypothetical protein [Legionella spiritensis]KTD61820.1 hypothetical protein Lspi_2450 [Legionella spiritensis]SNV31721.1 Uncharacterised protein [Legionella spiritensis]
MSDREFNGWKTFEELHEDYNVFTGSLRPQYPAPEQQYSNYYQEPGCGEAIMVQSEYAIFSYGVARCKKGIWDKLKSVPDSDNKIFKEFHDDLDILVANYKDRVNKDWKGGSTKELHGIMGNFKEDSDALIKKYEPHIESHESWSPFFSNALLLLSVIGALPALISMGNKLITGRYGFFDHTFLTEEQRSIQLPSEKVAEESFVKFDV